MRGWVALAAAVATLVVAAPSGAAPPTTAESRDRKRQIDHTIGQLRSQVAEASAEERDLLGALDASDERLERLNVAVGSLDRDILAAGNEVEAAQAHLDALERDALAARSRLARGRAQFRNARDEMEARAVAAYTGGPALDSVAELVLGRGDLRRLAARREYLTAVLQEQSRTVERYRRLRDVLAGLGASAEDARQQALAQRDVLIQHRTVLEDRRRVQDGIRQQAQGELAQREALLGRVRDRKAEFERQIAALRAESSQIAALLRRRQRGQVVQPSGRGVLAMPIPGAPVTSTFGPRVHPIFGDVRNHTGIDLEAAAGTPVRAAADGQVLFAGVRGGYGLATIIDHGGSLATLSAHQSRMAVAEGQYVTRGQLIGFVGATGFATGPHLHFEVRASGTPVDPMSYL